MAQPRRKYKEKVEIALVGKHEGDGRQRFRDDEGSTVKVQQDNERA